MRLFVGGGLGGLGLFGGGHNLGGRGPFKYDALGGLEWFGGGGLEGMRLFGGSGLGGMESHWGWWPWRRGPF